MKYLAALIALTLPLAAAPKKKEAQEALPDATLSQVQFGTVVNDKPLDPESFKGKVVVLDFWGVNCGPCIALLPEMAKLAHSGTAKGLVVIGMESQNSTKEAILPLLKKPHVEYPVTAGGNSHLSFTGIPYAAIYGADGKIVWVGHPGEEGFKRAISKALRDAKTAAPAAATPEP